MTNIKSACGAGLWMTVASLMMLATLEPVSIAPAQTQIAASANTGTAQG